MQKSTLALLERLFMLINIQFTKNKLKGKIECIDFVNIELISNTLTQYKIPNLVVKTSLNQLTEVPLPAIACFKEDDSIVHLLLEKISLNSVTGFNPISGTFKYSQEYFVKYWTGHLLLILPDEKSTEPDYENSRQEELGHIIQRLVAFGGLFTFVLLCLIGGFFYNWMIGVIFIIKMLGLAVCIVLLFEEYGKPIVFIHKLCNLSRHTDCTTVLRSPSAKLFRWLGWSEVGILYFAVSIVILTTSKSPFSIIYILVFLSFFSLVFTLFSLYYQWRVIKKWCTLCLSVLVILWLEALMSYLIVKISAFNLGQPASYNDLIFATKNFLLFIIIWFFVKPWLLASQDRQLTKCELVKYQQNSDLFRSYIKNSLHIPIATWDNELVMGNLDSPVTITIVSNPFCQPCSKAHKEISDWADFFNIKVVFRFFADPHMPDSEYNAFIRHLLSLSDQAVRLQALHAWYILQDYKQWSVLYPVAFNLISEQLLQRYSAWCQEIDIKYTPTIFINGYELKEPYSYNYLKFHLQDLIEKGL